MSKDSLWGERGESGLGEYRCVGDGPCEDGSGGGATEYWLPAGESGLSTGKKYSKILKQIKRLPRKKYNLRLVYIINSYQLQPEM